MVSGEDGGANSRAIHKYAMGKKRASLLGSRSQSRSRGNSDDSDDAGSAKSFFKEERGVRDTDIISAGGPRTFSDGECRAPISFTILSGETEGQIDRFPIIVHISPRSSGRPRRPVREGHWDIGASPTRIRRREGSHIGRLHRRCVICNEKVRRVSCGRCYLILCFTLG